MSRSYVPIFALLCHRMAIKWEQTTQEVYRKRAAQGNMVGWTGYFASTTGFRRAQIAKKEDWDEFTKDTYLCTYDLGAWNIPGAKNLTFLEGYDVMPRHPRQVAEPTWSILGAFHTALQKRLIVDGMHRAFQTEKDWRDSEKVRGIDVIECLGPEVHLTFPWDFRPLLATFSSC